MTDDEPIETHPTYEQSLDAIVETARSGALRNVRANQRFLAGSLVALAYRVGLPTYLGRSRPFDGPLPEELKLGFLIAMMTVEVLLIAICMGFNWHFVRITEAEHRDKLQAHLASHAELNVIRVGFLVAFSFKSVIELACLLSVCALSSQIFAMDDTRWSTANLGVVALLYVIYWPTAGRMDRWASRMSLAGWTRAVPPEFPG